MVADVAYNSVRNEFLVVWENRVVGDTEIFGRRLTSTGAPIGAAFQISGVPDAAGATSRQPAVAFDFERDKYAVAFTREDVGTDREVFVQLVSGTGALVARPGFPAGATQMSNSAPDSTFNNEVDVVYRPDASGDGTPGDGYIVAYGADDAVANDFDVMLAGYHADTGSFSNFNHDRIVSEATLEDAVDPALATIPGTDEIAVVWEGSTAGGDFEIYARRAGHTPQLATTGPQRKITATGDATHNAANPAVTAGGAGRFLVAYQALKSDPEGTEVFVQQLDGALGEIGTNDQQVSSAGPAGSGFSFTSFSAATAYLPGLDRFLVTWIGQDTGRPGLSNDEREVMGTILAPTGAEGSPQDFTISRVGVDVDEDFVPTDTAVAVNPTTKRWLSVWSADGAPAADNEIELFGRQIGENFDRDGDGSLFPADCNDLNAAVRPGARDVFDNGVDEDCVGGDAQNPDRDGDGSPRPQDCNDANAAIRPGIRDIPNNEVDEDCANGLRRTRPDVDIERNFAVFRKFTKVTKLRIKKLKPGMRVQLRCSGKGCPKQLRKKKVKRVTIKEAGTRDFTKLFKKAKLKPKAVIDVRVLQTGAIGRVDQFVIRNAKLPKRKQRCLPPGVKKPVRC
jgi:hypothetical protein